MVIKSKMNIECGITDASVSIIMRGAVFFIELFQFDLASTVSNNR